MLRTIKGYFVGLLLAIIALLWALLGRQKRVIAAQEWEQLQREHQREQARSEALLRQIRRQQDAAKQAQQERSQAEQALNHGRRDYFED